MSRKAFIMSSNGPDSIGRLKYAEKDAEDLASSLKGPRYGFEVITPQKGSKRFEILDALSDTALSCGPDDDFLCYFSGHGDLAKGLLHLVLEDKAENIEKISLDVDFVLKCIRQSRAKNKLFILDCCHSGGAAGMKSGSGQLVENVAPLNEADNHLVLMASERLSKIREYPDLQGSFLTQKIVTALDKEFFKVDKNKDQRISLQDLMDYLQESRTQYNRNKPPDEMVPLPYIFGQQKGTDFYFTQESFRWVPYEVKNPLGNPFILLPVKPNSKSVICMGRHPVTNAEYSAFIKETGHPEPVGRRLENDTWKFGFHPWQHDEFIDPSLPVVCVSYNDAIAYCNWMDSKLSGPSISKIFVPPSRLWTFAAYGEEYVIENYGASDRWTKKSPQQHDRSSAPAVIEPTGVRSNEAGLSDMFGNVWEWCAGNITVSRSIQRAFKGNPVLRGGGFLDDLAGNAFTPYLDAYQLAGQNIIVDSRNSHQTKINACHSFSSFDLGFRIAAFVPLETLPQDLQLKLSLCSPLSDSFWYDLSNVNVKEQDLKVEL